ncbi:MAG: hypothetical protein PHY92_01650 [Alphaproteobacteria bacterium]|nr:hypothetical protein [Alphaproteobacteria bacterium]
MAKTAAFLTNCRKFIGPVLWAALVVMLTSSAYADIPMCDGPSKKGTACIAKEVWDAIESVAPPGTKVNGKNIDKNLALKIHSNRENGGSAKPSTNPGSSAIGCMQILAGTRNLCLGKNGLPSTARGLYDAIMDRDNLAAASLASVKCASIVIDDHYKGCDTLAAGLCAYRWGGTWCTSKPGTWQGNQAEGGHRCPSCACGYAIAGFKACGVSSDGVVGTNPVTGEPNIQGMSIPSQSGASGPGTGPGKTMEPLNCVDLKLSQSLQMAEISFQTAKIAAIQQTYNQMQIKDGGACMLKLMTYFNTISEILSGAVSLIGTIVIGVLSKILSSICEFIVTGINNLLASICIPVPNLGFNLSLPQLTSQSCDGISLQNFISVTGHPAGLPPLSIGGYSMPSMVLPVDGSHGKPY